MSAAFRGTSSQVKLMRQLCHFVGKYGVAGIVVRTGSPAIGAAMEALRVACMIWESLDNYPGEIDSLAPDGPEDAGGGGGGGSW